MQLQATVIMQMIPIKQAQLNAQSKTIVTPEIAWELCLALRDAGLLAKTTHGHTIRLTPPLCIKEEQLGKALDILEQCLLKISQRK